VNVHPDQSPVVSSFTQLWKPKLGDADGLGVGSVHDVQPVWTRRLSENVIELVVAVVPSRHSSPVTVNVIVSLDPM
jgi:hypothetical protein